MDNLWQSFRKVWFIAGTAKRQIMKIINPKKTTIMDEVNKQNGMTLSVVTLKGSRSSQKTVKKDEKRHLHAMSPEQLKESITDSLKKYVEAKTKFSRSRTNTKSLERLMEKHLSTALLALDVLCKYVSSKEKQDELLSCPHLSKVYQQFIAVGVKLDVVSTSIPFEKWIAYREQFGLESRTDQFYLTGGTTIEENIAFQKRRYEKGDFLRPTEEVPLRYGTIE